jgi:hypothetical protein
MSATVARTIDDDGDHVESALDLVTAAAAAMVSANGDDDEGPLGRPLLLSEEEEPNDWARRHSRRCLHNYTRHDQNKVNSSSPRWTARS